MEPKTNPSESSKFSKKPGFRFNPFRKGGSWLYKILWIGFVGLTTLFIVSYALIYFYFNPFLKHYIIQKVQESSDSLYVLEINKLSINLFDQDVDLANVHLRLNPQENEKRQNTQDNQLDIDLKVGELKIEGIHWIKFLRTKKLHIEQFLLDQPEIYFHNRKNNPQKKEAVYQAPDRVMTFIEKFGKQVNLDDFHIRNAQVNLKAQNGDKLILHEGQDINLRITGIQAKKPTGSLEDDLQFERLEFQSGAYQFYSPNGDYQFGLERFRLSTSDSLFTLKNFQMIPRDSAWHNQLAGKGTKYTIDLPSLDMRGLDYKRLLYKQEIDLEKLIIQGLSLETERVRTRQGEAVSINESVARQKKDRKQEDALKIAIADIPFYVRMDTFQIRGSSLYIKEYKPEKVEELLTYHQVQEASVSFYNLAIGQALDSKQSNLPLYSSNVQVLVKGYKHQAPNGFFDLYIDKAQVISQDSLLEIENAYIKPRIDPWQISAQLPYQQIVLDAEVEKIRARQLDIERMVYQQEFVLGNVSLIAPHFKGYLDKKKPKKPGQKHKNFEEIIRSIPLFIEVDTFAIEQASLDYNSQKYLKNGEVGSSRHQSPRIDLRVTNVQFGKAFAQSTLQHIDKKSLLLQIQDYAYLPAGGKYQMGIGLIDVNSKMASIQLDSFYFSPALNTEAFAQKHPYRYTRADIRVGQVLGSHVNFPRLLLKQEIEWGKILMSRPQIDLYTDKRKPLPPAKQKTKSQKKERQLVSTTLSPKELRILNRNLRDTSGLRKFLRDIPTYIAVDTFLVSQATLDFRTQSQVSIGRGIAHHQADNINFMVNKIRLGKATQSPDFRNFYSGNIVLSLSNYRFSDPKDGFLFSLSGIKTSLRDSLLQINAIKVQPLLNREAFVASRPYRSAYIEAELKSIQVGLVDVERLVFDQEVIMRKLFLNRPKLYMYTDTRKPKKPKKPGRVKKIPTPEEMIEAIPVHIQMDTFALVDAYLEYDALKEKNGKTGIAQHRAQKFNISSLDISLGRSEYTDKTNKADQLIYTQDFQVILDDYTYLNSNQQTRLSVEQIATSVADSSLSIKNIHLEPLLSISAFDSIHHTFRKPRMDIQIENILFKTADLREVFNEQSHIFQSMDINNARFEVYQNATLPKDTSRVKGDPYGFLDSFPARVIVNTLNLNNARFHYQNKAFNKQGEVINKYQKADSIFVSLSGVDLNPEVKPDPKRIFFSDNLSLRLANYETLSADSLYRMRVGQLAADWAASRLTVKDFQFKPTVSNEVFNSFQPYETDIYDVHVASIDTRGINYPDLLNDTKIDIADIEIKDLDLNIYRDKRLDDKPDKIGMRPNKSFQKINLPMQVQHFAIRDSKINYREKVPESQGTGEVFFTDFNVQIDNLNTYPEILDTTHILLEGKIMGEGLLQLDLGIQLKSDTMVCEFEGSLGQMQAAAFNTFLESNARVKIENGKIEKIAYGASLRDTIATGYLAAGYKKLRIKLLKKEDNERKKGILSFLANLLIKNNSDADKKGKAAKIEYDIQEEDGFVKVLWKAIASGLVDTLKP